MMTRFPLNHLLIPLLAIGCFSAVYGQKKIVACLGNSITYGATLRKPAAQSYPALLQSKLGSICIVKNFGINARTMLKKGNNPYWNEKKFTELLALEPDIVTIMLGTNDSKPVNWAYASEYAADYAAMIDTIAGLSSHPAIILGLPPASFANKFTISGSVIADEIIPTIRTLAGQKGLPVVDVHTPTLDKSALLPDGVHPDAKGQKILADLFREGIENITAGTKPPTRLLWYGSAPGATGDKDTIDKPKLYVYPAPDSTRNGAAVLIFPGGGYRLVSMANEGHPVAEMFNGIGVTAFVLRYRVKPYKHPTPLNDAKRAMRIVRHHAADYGIDTARIGVCGFSAGGHLASTLGTLYDSGSPDSLDPIERTKSRPDFMVLIYPVITMTGSFTHTGSRTSLLGPSPSQALMTSMSSQLRVTSATPPAFLAHGDKDDVVAIENSKLFDSALAANGIAHEMIVDSGKAHGYGLEGAWPPACIGWLRDRNIIPSTGIGRRRISAVSARPKITFSGDGSVIVSLADRREATIEFFSVNGKRLNSVRSEGSLSFKWEPPARGIYALRISGNDRMVSMLLNCARP